MTQTKNPAPLQPTITTADNRVQETYEHGIVREWLDDRQIGIYYVPSVQREAIDLWYRIAEEAALAWPDDKLDLSIHDFSDVPLNAMLSTYVRMRVQNLARSTAENRGCVAVILPSTLMGRVARVFVEFNIKNTLKRETRVFLDREAALKWLKGYLDIAESS